jgi:hypothetical protein
VRPRSAIAVAVGADGHHGHVLHPGGDHQVLRAGQHALRREVQRLLRRAAGPGDGHAGHALGQAGREPGGARDVAGLRPDLADAAHDHVLDGGGVDPGAGDQLA